MTMNDKYRRELTKLAIRHLRKYRLLVWQGHYSIADTELRIAQEIVERVDPPRNRDLTVHLNVDTAAFTDAIKKARGNGSGQT